MIGPAFCNLVLALVGLVPSSGERYQFPDEYECRRQLGQCQRSLERLEGLRLASSDPDGRLGEWSRQTRHAVTYWQVLLSAQDRPWLHGEGWVVGRLVVLRGHVGWQRYRDRWHPPLFGQARLGLLGWRRPEASTGRVRDWWEVP